MKNVLNIQQIYKSRHLKQTQFNIKKLQTHSHIRINTREL